MESLMSSRVYSRVISFRLHPEKEQVAFDYLAEQEDAGRDTRGIIADALALAAARDKERQELDELMRQVAEQQVQALRILEKLESGAVQIVAAQDEDAGLTEDFANSLLAAARARPMKKLGG
jgi:hypothetical protein